MARPTEIPDQRKDKTIHVRLTSKEYERLMEATKAKGWSVPSQFIRWAINHASK